MLETSKEYALLINFHDFELLGKCDQISVLLCVVGFFFKLLPRCLQACNQEA